jgi:hypothetical protein
LRAFVLPSRFAPRAFGFDLSPAPRFLHFPFDVHSSTVERAAAVWKSNPIRQRATPLSASA